jgi:amino-acid N-acetyltransferase
MEGIVNITRVTPNTESGVQAVLAASRLMAVNTADSSTMTLAATTPQDEVVGCAAVERYGDNGLLRSVAVSPDSRGQHLGHYLVAAAEAEAAEGGIASLYLLTETAEAFFAALGYENVDRADVPKEVLASDQFAKLCPSSAVSMRRDLIETT